MIDKNVYNYTSSQQDAYPKDSDYCLTEEDFYPPADNRTWRSNVRDVRGGDNFADYCEYFFEMLAEEEYFES